MIRLLHGDCREVLPTLPEASVQCCVTSPPYWGLRDYGVEGQLGLEATPEEYLGRMVEVFREVRRVLRDDGTLWLNMGSSFASGSPSGSGDTSPSLSHARGDAPPCDSDGREPADYPPADRACFCCDDGHRAASLIHHARIAHSDLSEPQNALRLSLRGRDTALRDSGAASLGASPLDVRASTTRSTNGHDPAASFRAAKVSASRAKLRSCAADVLASVCSSCLNHTMFSQQFKPKDMVPMPWLLALALQADGWYLRSDIIWSKPNPMPESVTDRPTKAHEYVFLLTKAARYFYDCEAIREPRVRPGEGPGNHAVYDAGRPDGIVMRPDRGVGPEARNARSVWTIPSAPYPEAHFATFPPELARRCIVAGTSAKGCCAVCGAPWERDVERTGGPPNNRFRDGLAGDCKTAHDHGTVAGAALSRLYARHGYPTVTTVGWSPTCAHDAAPVPCTVLDPFGGSGTVGEVAEQNGRDAILIELSPAYVDLAKRRTAQRGLFAGIGA